MLGDEPHHALQIGARFGLSLQVAKRRGALQQRLDIVRVDLERAVEKR